MDLIVVPWTPGPLRRIPLDQAGDELRRRSGVPVDPSDADVAALLAAYDAVCADVPPESDISIAAHTLLLRTASLLRCRPPAGPAERVYVRHQLNCLGELADRHASPNGALAYLRATISHS